MFYIKVLHTHKVHQIFVLYFTTISSCFIHLYKWSCHAYEQTECAIMCVLFCAYTMYLQICQVYNPNTSNIFTIANGSEQIMIDPSDRRGQMYLNYRGPGEPNSGVQGPRYMRYTRSYVYIHCILEYVRMRSAVFQYVYLIILQKH